MAQFYPWIQFIVEALLLTSIGQKVLVSANDSKFSSLPEIKEEAMCLCFEIKVIHTCT